MFKKSGISDRLQAGFVARGEGSDQAPVCLGRIYLYLPTQDEAYAQCMQGIVSWSPVIAAVSAHNELYHGCLSPSRNTCARLLTCKMALFVAGNICRA